MNVFTYLFWPNLGTSSYDNPKILLLILLAVGLIIAAAVLKVIRGKSANPVFKKLSKSWPTACVWFGCSALLLTVSRVEGIQYLSMRVLWLVWAVAAILYLFLQFRLFRSRYYEVLPSQAISDPRDKYLPRRKKR